MQWFFQTPIGSQSSRTFFAPNFGSKNKCACEVKKLRAFKKVIMKQKKQHSTEIPPITKGGETHQTAGGDVPVLTTQQGTPISDDQNSLRIGARGPATLEDFHLREKIFHFDHDLASPVAGWYSGGSNSRMETSLNLQVDVGCVK